MNVNTTRRSVLKMTAAFAAMTGAASLTDRLAAASDFAVDASLEATAFPDDIRANPAIFAREAELHVNGIDEHLDSRVQKGFEENLAPEAWADFERAKAMFHKMHPGATPVHGVSEWSDVEDSALGFAMMCFLSGVEKGAIYEHLRASMVGTAQRCMQCNGTGFTHGSIVTLGADLEACSHCTGRGTVDALDTTNHWAFLDGFPL